MFVSGGISINNVVVWIVFVEVGYGLVKIFVYDVLLRIKVGLLWIILDDYKIVDIEFFGVFLLGVVGSKKLWVLFDYLKDYFIN